MGLIRSSLLSCSSTSVGVSAGLSGDTPACATACIHVVMLGVDVCGRHRIHSPPLRCQAMLFRSFPDWLSTPPGGTSEPPHWRQGRVVAAEMCCPRRSREARLTPCPFQSTRSKKPCKAVRSFLERIEFVCMRRGLPCCLPSVSCVERNPLGRMFARARPPVPSPDATTGRCAGLLMPALCSFRAIDQKRCSPAQAALQVLPSMCHLFVASP